MQAYQSPPCPYCGITWNQPGAQTCANCRNQLPPPQASYAPPGYAPQQGYPQQPQYPVQPGQYPSYAPPGYDQTPGYPQQPGYGQPYPGYGPAEGPGAAPGTTLRLFGQVITLPFVVPPQLLRFPRKVVPIGVGVLVLLVLFLGVLPAIASSQISAANQSLMTAASHQAKVDAAFAQLIGSSNSSNDPAALKAQFAKLAVTFNDGLNRVQSDEAALISVDQRLSIIKWGVPSKGAQITTERQRIAAALAGLQPADKAMTSAVNEAKLIQPYLDALIDYAKMSAALAKHDLVGAGAPYPDAQAKMEQAMSLTGAPGLAPQIAKQVSSFNDVLTNTESLIQAIQAKDPAGIKKYTDATNAALKAMSSPEETLPADYESKTFGPMQKAYDAAMKAIKTGR
jgi:hypothetical protein